MTDRTDSVWFGFGYDAAGDVSQREPQVRVAGYTRFVAVRNCARDPRSKVSVLAKTGETSFHG